MPTSPQARPTSFSLDIAGHFASDGLDEAMTCIAHGSQGAAQSRFGWSWAGFGLLTQAEDGEEETWVVANLP
jgi:hypothetical protein